MHVMHAVIRSVVAFNCSNDHRGEDCVIDALSSRLCPSSSQETSRNARLRSWEPPPRRLVGLLLMLYSRCVELA